MAKKALGARMKERLGLAVLRGHRNERAHLFAIGSLEEVTYYF
jgi:hypothetical protein